MHNVYVAALTCRSTMTVPALKCVAWSLITSRWTVALMLPAKTTYWHHWDVTEHLQYKTEHLKNSEMQRQKCAILVIALVHDSLTQQQHYSGVLHAVKWQYLPPIPIHLSTNVKVNYQPWRKNIPDIRHRLSHKTYFCGKLYRPIRRSILAGKLRHLDYQISKYTTRTKSGAIKSC